jgi:beta-glucosidase
LKNSNNVLPLNKPKSIGVIGNGAGNSSVGPNGYTDRGGDSGVLAMGWGSGTDNFPYLVAPVDAITSRASQDGTTVTSSLSDTDLNGATNAAKGKSVAFVFITADSGEIWLYTQREAVTSSYLGEGYITVEGNAGDRNDLNAWHSGVSLRFTTSKVPLIKRSIFPLGCSG